MAISISTLIITFLHSLFLSTLNKSDNRVVPYPFLVILKKHFLPPLIDRTKLIPY